MVFLLMGIAVVVLVARPWRLPKMTPSERRVLWYFDVVPMIGYLVAVGVFIALNPTFLWWVTLPAVGTALWAQHRLRRLAKSRLYLNGDLETPPGQAVVPKGEILIRTRRSAMPGPDGFPVYQRMLQVRNEGELYYVESAPRELKEVFLAPGTEGTVIGGKFPSFRERQYRVKNVRGQAVIKRI